LHIHGSPFALDQSCGFFEGFRFQKVMDCFLLTTRSFEPASRTKMERFNLFLELLL
jgi:hypothetical protein